MQTREELIEILKATALGLGKLHDKMNALNVVDTTLEDWMMLGVLTSTLYKDAKELKAVDDDLLLRKKAA